MLLEHVVVSTIMEYAEKHQTLGFLRRNIKTMNERLKNAAYKAFVQPVLEYASPVWDPFTANNIKALEKVQRRLPLGKTVVGKTELQKISVRGHHATTALATLESGESKHASPPSTSSTMASCTLSKICLSKSDHPARTTRHTHNLTYDIPSHRTTDIDR